MKGILCLAWRYVWFHRWQTAILWICLTLTFFLPVAIHFLLGNFQRTLWARSEATPMVMGAKGSRFDLVFHALYFGGRTPEMISVAEADAVRETGFAQVVPLYVNFRARGYPIVGTSLEYFEIRGLRMAAGRLLFRLGECVVGASVAEALELEVGDSLMSDPENVFNIAGGYPLKMRVVGVLSRLDSADDEAVFVDIKTAWIIAGIGHGHMDLEAAADDSVVLRRSDSNIVANAALVQYMEITDQNIDSFHFHAASGERPLSGLLVFPRDVKSGTLLRGRYNTRESRLQVLRPREVVSEMMRTVMKARRFLDLNSFLVTVIAGLFLVLVTLLSLRLREKEMETLFLLGCRRGTVLGLVATEFGLVFLASGLSTVVLTLMAYSSFELWLNRMLG
ncbi:MAG: hypothetical protein M2R45_04203 [Verrucomicrobia subdivision 3 bacterium]|nr:hypothetical protein [Limisphaerales bacterium]MCS1417060.1 hypothetical protein [Limisphaerales bacterium]